MAAHSVFHDDDASDCFGHGTHVAALAAGLTYGVAKNASIIAGIFRREFHKRSLFKRDASLGHLIHAPLLPHPLPPVRCVACNGTSSAARVVAGMDWVAANMRLPAVVSLSIGADRPNALLDRAAEALLSLGAVVVAAAGNYNDGEDEWR